MNQRIVLLLLLFGITLSSYAQKDKNVEWAAIPAPSYNEVQGFGLTVTAGLFYDLSKKDTVSTPSSTFVYGFYAENESWVGAIFHQSYLNENRNWFDMSCMPGATSTFKSISKTLLRMAKILR